MTQTPMSALPSLADLDAAYEATAPVACETPLLDARLLSERAGGRVLVKAESLQRTGSFKFRGAYFRLSRLGEDEKTRGVVAYSSGNFAQGLAAAGAIAGVPVTLVMPNDAPQNKIEATRSYGAEIVLSDHGDRPREEVAAELARTLAVEDGLTLLHPFDDPLIVAGQAAAGLELIRQLAGLDLTADGLLVCTGGGGLLGGMALAFHHLSPETRIYAVEPQGFDSMGQSLEAGAPTRLTVTRSSICDALQATKPGTPGYEAARTADVTGIAVDDDTVRQAVRLAFEDLKLVLEPSGAIAIAALLSGGIDCAGKTIVAMASGGNIAPERFAELLAA